MLRRVLGIGLASLAVLMAHAAPSPLPLSPIVGERGRGEGADEAVDEQKAIEAIQKSGGTVQVDDGDPAKPAVSVDLGGDKVDDAELAPLEALTHLRRLFLGGAHVSDAGLAHVRRLTKMQKLYLTDTPITDAGLAHLEDLARLEVVDLAGTKITDAGLAHLEDMPKLQVLDLSHTGVSAAGLEHLKKLNSLRELYLIGLKPPDQSEADKAAEFEQKVLDFLKEQPQVKVVR